MGHYILDAANAGEFRVFSLVIQEVPRKFAWLRINSFEACSAFTHVTACLIARSPKAILCTEGFSSFVTSTAAPIATGWSDPVTGRDLHPLDLCAFPRRTSKRVTFGEL